jgi:hypothetical protein
MSAELTTILLSFQPDSPELVQRREYDAKARQFVSQLSPISSTHWSKGAETPQDVLSVSPVCCIDLEIANFTDTQPRRQLNSIRLCPPPPHRSLGREEEYTRVIAARRLVMESASTLPRDCGPDTAAICGKGVEGAGGVHRAHCARMRISMLTDIFSAREDADYYSRASLLRQCDQL